MDKLTRENLKTILLYILIGGLAAAALVSIGAILIGEFNSAIQNSLGTIFLFVSHSLFILGLIWADKKNAIGEAPIPTAMLGVALANLLTTTLGIWDVINGELSAQANLFYALLLGVAFILTGLTQLRIKEKLTDGFFIATGSIVGGWALALVPWIFSISDDFDPLYYRIISALTVLFTTTFLIGLILRSVAIGRKQAHPQKLEMVHGGMLVYYIAVGVVVSFVWLIGSFAFTLDAIDDTYDKPPLYEDYR